MLELPTKVIRPCTSVALLISQGSGLARLALAGQVPEADQQTTFHWFQEQAEIGDLSAAFNLGLCLAETVAISVVHLVSEKPSGTMGRKWYAFYTGTPPKLLGGIMSDEELGYERGNVFLVVGECRRYIAITSTVAVEQKPTCPAPDEIDY